MEEKEEKGKGILVGVIFLLLLIALPTFEYFRTRTAAEIPDSRNASARSCYNALVGMTILESILPQQETIVSGDITDFRIIDLDAGPVSEKPLVLAGMDETSDAKLYYWSARCEGGRIKEVWLSESQLSSGQLRPYTIEEQKKQTGFIGRIGYKVIGYYCAEQ